MKKGIHPKVNEVQISCVCGASFKAYSVKESIEVGICDKCHPFYTGQQKFVDTAGRIEKFASKFGKLDFDKSERKPKKAVKKG